MISRIRICGNCKWYNHCGKNDGITLETLGCHHHRFISKKKEFIRLKHSKSAKTRHASMSKYDKQKWRDNLSKAYTNMPEEAKEARNKKISEGGKKAHELRLPEAEASRIAKISRSNKETYASTSSKEKARRNKKTSETLLNKSPQEKARIKKKYRDTMDKKSPEL